jgi:predicted HTH domain antitoxin
MTLTIDYPSLLPDALQQSRSDFEREARFAMAVKLFEIGRISSGVAAVMAGISRVEFLLELHRYGVSMNNLSDEEIFDDIRNV